MSDSSETDLELLENDLYTDSSSENEERRTRTFKIRIHHTDLNDTEFKCRFRLSRESVEYVLQKIGAQLAPATARNQALLPTTQLLLTLRFFAIGVVLLAAGDFVGVSKATACITVWRVAKALASLKKDFIKMSCSSSTQEKFYNIAKFPSIIGAIDCTHVRLQSPGGAQAEVFRNRKGYFSLNVQCICDADLIINNIVVKWPGSSHDSMIFNASVIKSQFEQNVFGSCMLVGDSGYPLRKYLMTPLSNPQTPEEILYNESQIRTRNVIERCFGVLKRRFPILYLPIRLSVERAQAVIVAVAVLHNICRLSQEELPLDNDEDVIPGLNETLEDNYPEENSNNLLSNDIYRRDLIENYFRQLL